MPTKIKVAYSEAQKAWTSQVEVSSDELSREEVMSLAKSIAIEAGQESQYMTLQKLRS